MRDLEFRKVADPFERASVAQEGTASSAPEIGALAYLIAELDERAALLRQAPLWLPGRALLEEAAALAQRFEALESSLRDVRSRLVITIVGPSGSGKSSLLNALVGQNVAPTGLTRPTTRQVTAYASEPCDLDAQTSPDRIATLGADSSSDVPDLSRFVLVDTPGTNTVEGPDPRLEYVLGRTDLMLVVLAAPNPKIRDNIVFLRPFVARLPAGAILVALNMADRVPIWELTEDVVPDLRRELSAAWGRDTDAVYLVSARARTPGAQFLADEEPLHDVNDVTALRDAVARASGSTNRTEERRLANAEHLMEGWRGRCAARLGDTAAERDDAERQLARLISRARETLPSVATAPRENAHGTSALLRDLLARRWRGPIAWLMGAWRALSALGSFAQRFSARAQGVGNGASRTAISCRRLASDLQAALERLYLEEWPLCSDALARAEFDSSVREAIQFGDGREPALENIVDTWAAAERLRVTRLASRLSSWPLQLAFNAPLVALVLWVCVEVVLAFFLARHLPSDYPRSAAMAVSAVWIMSFALFQVIAFFARRHGERTSLRAALERATEGPGDATDTTPVGSEGPLQATRGMRAQLAVLRDLERAFEETASR